MDENIEELREKIAKARTYAERIFENRAHAIALLCGFVPELEFEYPEPDRMNIYLLMFGHRMQPTQYRLSFGKRLKWVGVSHPWGVKPADILVPEER